MQVLSLNECAERADLSRRSLERLIASGKGPVVIALSTRRRGVLESDFEAWLLGRRRPSPGSVMPATAAPVKRGPGRPRKVPATAGA